MRSDATGTSWLRRAQPLLGTLVEIGVLRDGVDPKRAIDAAFARIRLVHEKLSRFDAYSDIGRFHLLECGGGIDVHADTVAVLAAAAELRDATGGLFDVSLGTAVEGWHCADGRLHKLVDGARLDLGGIGKGHAVDCAVQSLVEQGTHSGWVNAGGDLRSFGEVDVPIHLRDERHGGVRPFASLREGAFATSRRDGAKGLVHTSVAAPQCIWADALNKIVAATTDASHPLLARYEAVAWIH